MGAHALGNGHPAPCVCLLLKSVGIVLTSEVGVGSLDLSMPSAEQDCHEHQQEPVSTLSTFYVCRCLQQEACGA
jgi:hypothetical protein